MIIGIDASRAFVDSRTGTENYSYYLITEMLRLPEAKLHVFVLFTRPNAFLPKELDGYSNVIVKEVKWKYLWTQGGLALETWREIVAPYSRIAVNPDKETNNERINGLTDSRHLDVLWIPAHTLPVLRNPKLKTVVTIHGLEYQWLKEYKNLLQRWYLPLSTFYAAKYANKLIAVSKFTAKQLIEQLHTDKLSIKVIHEGVEMQRESVNPYSSKSVMERYGIQAKQYILFVGSIQPRKNLVALIEAFSLVAKSFPGLKLVIAGGVGWEAEGVVSAPNRYRVEESVVFTGRVSEMELRELYRGAAVYAQPSITEGFGLPVLEAMAHRVPVVSSDGGALSEVVGEAGVIVALKTDFVKKLAGALERVIGDKKLQTKLVSIGLERVKDFSWAKSAKTTLEYIAG